MNFDVPLTKARRDHLIPPKMQQKLNEDGVVRFVCSVLLQDRGAESEMNRETGRNVRQSFLHSQILHSGSSGEVPSLHTPTAF